MNKIIGKNMKKKIHIYTQEEMDCALEGQKEKLKELVERMVRTEITFDFNGDKQVVLFVNKEEVLKLLQ